MIGSDTVWAVAGMLNGNEEYGGRNSKRSGPTCSQHVLKPPKRGHPSPIEIPRFATAGRADAAR
jgi:hypothetical protein